MSKLLCAIFITLLGTSLQVHAQSTAQEYQELTDAKKRKPKYYYGYKNRSHTMSERFKHVGAMYVVTWPIYYITQPDTIREKGSFSLYKKNFGRLVFDKDEPFWNWFVHPISGSQLFLFYRANGYNRIESLAMSFVSSTLFELTVEIYTEPASIQDLYQTPVLGALLGVAFENLSMYLLNTGNLFGRLVGHIINPATLFWFYEGRIQITPYTDGKKSALNMHMTF